MAGFFGLFDYNKTGPGVPKPDDSKPKNGLMIFFEVLQRKFWNIMKIGMMFFIFNSPAFIIATFITYIFSVLFFSTNGTGLETTVLVFWGSVMVTVFPLINIGPVRAGIEAIFRNYSKEEHSFIWTEFKNNMKSNLKQSSIISLINLLVLMFLVFDISVITKITFGSSIIGVLYNSMFILTFVIYLMANIYIYPLMVTFELKVKDIIKNSLMFAVARFIPNLFVLAILFAVLTLPFIYLNPVFAMLISFILLYGVLGFMLSFFAQRGFKKYILDKMIEKKRTSEDNP